MGIPKANECPRGLDALRGIEATIFRKQAEQNLGVCPECNHHFLLSARERIADLLDAGTFEEWKPVSSRSTRWILSIGSPYRERVMPKSAAGLKNAAV